MGSIDQNEFTIKCEIEGIVDKIFPDNLKISEEISELYTGRTLIFIKKNSLNLKNLLSKSIFFEISLKQKKRTFYGIITQIESLEKFEKKDILYDSYMIFFSHPLFKLTLTKNSRIFQNKNLETIISEIFAKNKLQIDKTFNIVGEFSKSNIEYCIQYEESDFQFISRLMEHYGVFYFFNYQGSKNNPPKIIISNTSNKYINFIQEYQIPMDYGTNIDKSPIAKMQIFREKTKLENISYTTNSYNFESPNNNLETMKNDGNLGEYYEWNSYNNKDTGKIIAKLRTGNKENSVETYYGESMYPFLSVGYFFKLEKNYIDAINKEYVVTKISHFFVHDYFVTISTP